MGESKDKPDVAPSRWLKESLEGNAESYRLFLEWASRFTRQLAKKRLSSWRLNSEELVDDFVQEVLLAVHQKRHTYLTHLPVEPWLSGIIRFKSIDWLRRVIAEGKRLSFEDHEGHHAEDGGAAHDIGAVLATLNENQRRLLELAKLEGLSIEEISLQTGLSASAVKVGIHRAMKGLQKKFGGRGGS